MTRKKIQGMIGVMICLLLFGTGGCKSNETPKTTPTPFAISCSASGSQGEPGLVVQFNCNASGGTGGYTYSWTFGDNQISSQQNPTHTYNAIGNFSAKVTVVSGGGDFLSWSQDIKILINHGVSVGGGGGSASVTFNTTSSLRIRITLTGATSLVPYGYLEGPGYSDYFPPLATASNGTNTGELNLSQAGSFSLTVFEGNNIGGTVNVKIEVI